MTHSKFSNSSYKFYAIISARACVSSRIYFNLFCFFACMYILSVEFPLGRRYTYENYRLLNRVQYTKKNVRCVSVFAGA